MRVSDPSDQHFVSRYTHIFTRCLLEKYSNLNPDLKDKLAPENIHLGKNTKTVYPQSKGILIAPAKGKKKPPPPIHHKLYFNDEGSQWLLIHQRQESGSPQKDDAKRFGKQTTYRWNCLCDIPNPAIWDVELQVCACIYPYSKNHCNPKSSN